MPYGKGVLAASTAIVLLSLVPAIAPVAYGYGKLAVWQIGASFNCNNPTFCGPVLGGFWIWAEFDSDNTGDATGTGCGHLSSPGGPGLAGADHFNAEITGWTIASGSAGPSTFFVTGGTMTLTGHTGGPPVTVPIIGDDGVNPASPSNPLDTGIPAVAGHYNTAMILGFTPPPGVAFQIQVVKIPNR